MPMFCIVFFINPRLGKPAGGTINSSAQLRVIIIAVAVAFYQEERPERCSSCELPGATGGISLLQFWRYMWCLLVYLYFVDCHHVLLSTPRHSLGFVPANHRQLSLSILEQLCDWRWSHLLGKNVKVHSPFQADIFWPHYYPKVTSLKTYEPFVIK